VPRCGLLQSSSTHRSTTFSLFRFWASSFAKQSSKQANEKPTSYNRATTSKNRPLGHSESFSYPRSRYRYSTRTYPLLESGARFEAFASRRGVEGSRRRGRGMSILKSRANQIRKYEDSAGKLWVWFEVFSTDYFGESVGAKKAESLCYLLRTLGLGER
jgi:hypothetical protein